MKVILEEYKKETVEVFGSSLMNQRLKLTLASKGEQMMVSFSPYAHTLTNKVTDILTDTSIDSKGTRLWQI